MQHPMANHHQQMYMSQQMGRGGGAGGLGGYHNGPDGGPYQPQYHRASAAGRQQVRSSRTPDFLCGKIQYQYYIFHV